MQPARRARPRPGLALSFLTLSAFCCLCAAAAAQEPARAALPTTDSGDPAVAADKREAAKKNLPGPTSDGATPGKALRLPIPTYPLAAIRAHVRGSVRVNVEIDEGGKVTAARAVAGPPLLRGSSEDAARGTVFAPALVSGRPVKSTGTISYLFRLGEDDEEVNASVGEETGGAMPAAEDETAAIGTKAALGPPVALGPPSPLTSTYRVGVGDVLDVRLLDKPTDKSTLFSVLEGGILDYAPAGSPSVQGLTTEEIRAAIAAELKRRSVSPDPKLFVGVRAYASHLVTVSGLVGAPGDKILRREAVPLYVILAEAQPRPEAGRVQVVSRAAGLSREFDLQDPATLEFLVYPGDVISVSARPLEHYYIAGLVKNPGQKIFSPGITLTQAILSAGGITRPSTTIVEIGRPHGNGLLSFDRYDIRKIKTGKLPDPPIQPGDRIEVLK